MSARTAEYQALTSWSLQSSQAVASPRLVGSNSCSQRLTAKTVPSRFWAHISARHDVEHRLYSPSHTSDWRKNMLAVQRGVAPASNHGVLEGERKPTQSQTHGPGRALRRIWANEIQVHMQSDSWTRICTQKDMGRKLARATTWSTSSTAQTRRLTSMAVSWLNLDCPRNTVCVYAQADSTQTMIRSTLKREQRTSQDRVSARTADHQAPISWSVQSSKV